MALKKIVFYLSDFESGGTEWFALRLGRALAAEPFSIQFLVSRDAGPLAATIQREFKTTLLSGTGYSFWGLARTLPSFLRFLDRERPDFLISGLPLLNLMAYFALTLSGSPCRLIAVEHMRLTLKNERLSSRFKLMVKRFLNRGIQRKSHAFVCVSKTVLKDLFGDKATPRNVYVINNPIIPDDLGGLLQSPASHPWLNEKGFPLILSIGRLLPVKDFPTLVRAFHFISDQTTARLIVLGDGEERPKLEALVKMFDLTGRVSFCGAVDNVFPYLKRADLFVLSSKEEAFGNVLVEALASGVPVVSTACGGTEEILDNGLYGVLVPVQNPEVLGQAILRALASPHNKHSLHERGQSFSVKSAAKAYTALFNA